MWAKLLFFLLLAAASAAVPFSDDLVTSTLPAICDAFRECLSPSYLFVAVNLIILTIWKLSEKTDSIPDKSISIPPTTPHRVPRPLIPIDKEEEELKTHSDSSTLTTTDHHHENPSSPESRSAQEAVESSWVVVAGVGAAERGRGATSGAAPVASPSVTRVLDRVEVREAEEPALELNRTVNEAVEEEDEMNRRFEEFIKKVNRQMRQEPASGYVARRNHRRLYSAN